MEGDTIKVLRGLGISAGAIIVIGGIAVGFYTYTKYLEAIYLKLQIKQIKKDLGIEEGPSIISQIEEKGAAAARSIGQLTLTTTKTKKSNEA